MIRLDKTDQSVLIRISAVQKAKDENILAHLQQYQWYKGKNFLYSLIVLFK
jgi:sulfate adenylyltransferase subunit 1 (EFTu-like GTPase family)